MLSDPRAASVPGLQDLELMHPARTLLGDMYVAFRLLFVATMTPVSAMLVANAKGVQVGWECVRGRRVYMSAHKIRNLREGGCC